MFDNLLNGESDSVKTLFLGILLIMFLPDTDFVIASLIEK